MPVTDQELIEKAKRGDNAAFGELWARYERLVVALCRRYVKGSIHDLAVDDHDLCHSSRRVENAGETRQDVFDRMNRMRQEKVAPGSSCFFIVLVLIIVLAIGRFVI